MSKEELSMAEVAQELRSIKDGLIARDKLDEERRKVDDARDRAAEKAREELLKRVDAHGIRTTTLETQWSAFFGEQGAFKLFIKKLEGHDSKIDRLVILGAIGTTLVLAGQWAIPMLFHK